MSKDIKITKLSQATRDGMTKCAFKYEYTAPNGLKSQGEGRFAVLAGNPQNFKAAIHADLKRRLGSDVNIIMPENHTLSLKKAG